MAFHAKHVVGQIPDPAAQGSAIKWLLKNFTSEQCEDVYQQIRSEAWRTTPVTWLTVKKEIGTRLNRPASKQPLPDTPFGYDDLGRKILSDDGGCYTIMGPDGTPSKRWRTDEALSLYRGITVEEVRDGTKR